MLVRAAPRSQQKDKALLSTEDRRGSWMQLDLASRHVSTGSARRVSTRAPMRDRCPSLPPPLSPLPSLCVCARVRVCACVRAYVRVCPRFGSCLLTRLCPPDSLSLRMMRRMKVENYVLQNSGLGRALGRWQLQGANEDAESGALYPSPSHIDTLILSFSR